MSRSLEEASLRAARIHTHAGSMAEIEVQATNPVVGDVVPQMGVGDVPSATVIAIHGNPEAATIGALMTPKRAWGRGLGAEAGVGLGAGVGGWDMHAWGVDVGSGCGEWMWRVTA